MEMDSTKEKENDLVIKSEAITPPSTSSTSSKCSFQFPPDPTLAKDGLSPDNSCQDLPTCVVCLDKASGYHYGVFTCEGCKGFFKRTVQKNLEYTCRGSKDCEINQFSRNRCQYCRYMKCVEAGMLKEAVREDRTPGGRHRHKSLQQQSGGPKTKKIRTSSKENTGSPGSYTESTPSGTAPQVSTPDNYKETIDILVQGGIKIIPSGCSENATEMNVLMQLGYQDLYNAIQWAKCVPGFRELDTEDQVNLLKAAFMDLNYIRLAFRSLDCEVGTYRFADGVVLDVENSIRLGWTKDLCENTSSFIEKLRKLHLDDQEYACICALILLTPDAPDLHNKEKVSKLQQHVTSCFRQYEADTFPEQKTRFGKLLLCLPTIRSYSEIALAEFVAMEFFGKIDVPPLVQELLES